MCEKSLLGVCVAAWCAVVVCGDCGIYAMFPVSSPHAPLLVIASFWRKKALPANDILISALSVTSKPTIMVSIHVCHWVDDRGVGKKLK